MTWFSPRDLEAGGVRLFCLPHAGSGAAGFYRWKRLLPSGVAVCPVRLPGREARLGERSLTGVPAIVEALQTEARAALDRPYAVFGHSMGALLAYEWTRRIAAEGLRAPVCLFASGRNAPTAGGGSAALHGLPSEELVSELQRRYGGAPEALLAPEMRELFLPVVRSDLQVVDTYRFVPGPPLFCPVRAIAGQGDRSVSPEGLDAWAETTRGSFTGRRFAGDHFFHFGAGQEDLLAFIAETLASAALSSSQAED